MIDLLNEKKFKNKGFITEPTASSHSKVTGEESKTPPQSSLPPAVRIDEEGEEKNDKSDQVKKPRLKINTSRYKDPEGLTEQKMKLGLWLVVNRKNIIAVFIGILMAVSISTWGLFFYTFGKYTLIGMKEDRELVEINLYQNLPTHKFFLDRAAKPLQYSPIKALKSTEGKYDFILEVSNPSPNYYAKINFHFSNNNQEFGHAEEFFLPGETKYIMSLSNTLESTPSNIRININETDWTRISNKIYPDWEDFNSKRLKFTFKDKIFTPANINTLTEKLNLNELQFTALNNSAFNYWEVPLKIFLKSGTQIVGVSTYHVNKFMSGESRPVNVTWVGKLPKITDIVVIPNIDITNENIYIKIEGGTGEFK